MVGALAERDERRRLREGEIDLDRLPARVRGAARDAYYAVPTVPGTTPPSTATMPPARIRVNTRGEFDDPFEELFGLFAGGGEILRLARASRSSGFRTQGPSGPARGARPAVVRHRGLAQPHLSFSSARTSPLRPRCPCGSEPGHGCVRGSAPAHHPLPRIDAPAPLREPGRSSSSASRRRRVQVALVPPPRRRVPATPLRLVPHSHHSHSILTAVQSRPEPPRELDVGGRRGRRRRRPRGARRPGSRPGTRAAGRARPRTRPAGSGVRPGPALRRSRQRRSRSAFVRPIEPDAKPTPFSRRKGTDTIRALIHAKGSA